MGADEKKLYALALLALARPSGHLLTACFTTACTDAEAQAAGRRLLADVCPIGEKLPQTQSEWAQHIVAARRIMSIDELCEWAAQGAPSLDEEGDGAAPELLM